MKYEITSPTGQRFEVTAPDDASQEQVLSYAQGQFTQPEIKQEKVSATEGIPAAQLMLEGVGQGMTNVGRGIGQRLGLLSEADIADRRKWDAPLEDSAAGKVGSIAGNLAVLAPAMMVPGANTVAGAGAIGALSGALQPTVAGESVLKNAAVGAALGSGSQYGVGKLAGFAGKRLTSAEASGAAQEAQNAVRDATLKEVQGAGYALPPSQTGSGVIPRVLEGISGKAKTNQAMGVKNQNLTDSLSRKALGLAEDAPLTRETMQTIRNDAYASGYEPVAMSGTVKASPGYEASLDTIKSNYQGAANSFPGAAKNEVSNLVDDLKVKQFDAGDAIKMTRVLRDQADTAFSQGDKALGRAAKEAAKAIEDELERHLAGLGKNGAQLLQNFRDARTLMAKSGSVERAIIEGGGNVNAKVLGAALQRGKPLTGELKTIAKFANNFGDVAGVPKSGWTNPITTLDAFQAAGMAGMGAGPMSLALPAARIGARSLLLNPAFQRSLVGPSYGPGLLGRSIPATLEKAQELGVGGLLGATYANQ